MAKYLHVSARFASSIAALFILLLCPWRGGAASSEELFVIRAEIRLTGTDNYQYRRYYDDGFLASKSERTEAFNLLYTGCQEIRIVSDRWDTTEYSDYSVFGGGRFESFSYDPPSSDSFQCSYSLDNSKWDPTNSGIVVGFDPGYGTGRITAVPDFPALVTGPAQGNGFNLASILLGSSINLFGEIQFPTNATTYEITHTYTDAIVTPYTAVGESGQAEAHYACHLTIQRNPLEPLRPSLDIAREDGGCHLKIRGSPKRRYLVWASTNLNSWPGISTNVATNGIVHLFIPKATDSQTQFYYAEDKP